MNFHGSVAENLMGGRQREQEVLESVPIQGRKISSAISAAYRSILSRQVFGVMGIPIDALNLASLLAMIRAAAQTRTPFLLSTPNVNFLLMSRVDKEFRESLLVSDVCPVDGMPIVWIARLLGVKVEKVSGCEIFDALRSPAGNERPLNVFLFGGADDLAETVSAKLNAEAQGLACVGAINPGFGSITDMSNASILDSINDSNADLLTVFLSAKKAQGWLLRNHLQLQVPFRAQFGTTINFQAGTVKRAPELWRVWGFEWLWRIKEEPHLWRRYWADGRGLAHLLVTCVLPLAATHYWRRFANLVKKTALSVDRDETIDNVTFKLKGDAVEAQVDQAISYFAPALRIEKSVRIDISNVRTIDARFFGLLLTLRKHLLRQGLRLDFTGATPRMKRAFRWNGFEYLLNPGT
jgi:N-acetylglucosaminyldiphosphoundecaprenol N-acetyl-beta-D-mannosaminyltransferase